MGCWGPRGPYKFFIRIKHEDLFSVQRSYVPKFEGICIPFSGPNQYDIVKQYKTSWWFQPIWKILVKLDIFPKQGWK